MPLINYAKREITYKLVYYGTGLGGKTTNLKYIHGQINPACRGDMIQLATETERTLFFDFMPIELEAVSGFRLRLAIYTVPGQAEYERSRKQILRGSDGIVFVADSSITRADANRKSLDGMYENLRFNNISLADMPWVLQYNKRDLADAMTVDRMQQELNPGGIPFFEAVALEGKGVFSTLKDITQRMINKSRTHRT